VIIILESDEAQGYLRYLAHRPRDRKQVPPQTAGRCNYDDGKCTRRHGSEHEDICPHLNNPDITCSVKRMLARRALVYKTAAPEWVEPAPDDGAPHTYTMPATRKPTNPNAWSDEEIEVIRRAQSAAEAERLYSETYGIWKRSRRAVTTRWYKLRAAGELIAPAPTPDFVGDTTPVTQCDEEPVFVVPRPTFRLGDRVRIKHALHRGQTGKIKRYLPATENYLVAIDGMPDMVWLSKDYLEAV